LASSGNTRNTRNTRRPSSTSRNLAQELQPIIEVHARLRARFQGRVDLIQARARITAGRSAFDAAAVIVSVGDLAPGFEQAARAFERTGMASSASITGVRRAASDATALTLAWSNSESQPRDPVLKLARSIAGVVGNALLARAASEVTQDFSLEAWKWPQCPCCGASPDLAVAIDAARTLVCWRCDTMWTSRKAGCLGCGESDPMTIARVASPYLGYELAICNACGRYLKERRGSLTHALLVERALIAGLDEAAQLRGLRA
jgi:hypothetical protein